MKVYETQLSGDINLYDFVIIASDSFLQTGFYCGRGPTGTFQFYTTWSLAYWYDTRKDEEVPSKLKPFKSYINSPSGYRIAKYSPELLTEERKENYYKALEAFKLLNIEL